MDATIGGPTPQDITVAITVYDRQNYLREAIRSALSQTTPNGPRVIIVEDCGPSPSLRTAITNEFGDSIEYFRSSMRRGLCDNWNACIEVCETQWLCILHDDDVLEPTFLESMIELATAAPGRALYYGVCNLIDENGKRLNEPHRSDPFAWHELDLEYWTRHQPVCFPGQLFNVAAARSLGGFRPASQYCADWEMWFKLALNYGVAATNRVVANYREHWVAGRGTTTADMRGRRYAYSNMQRKRHVAWLRDRRPDLRFNRRKFLTESPMSIRYLLQNARGFPRRMLRYNVGLLKRSTPPHWGYRLFQNFARLLPGAGWKMVSSLFRWVPSRYESPEDSHGGDALIEVKK